MSMAFKIEEKMKLYSGSERELGKSTIQVLKPHFEAMMLHTYKNAIGADWDKLPADVEQLEGFKFDRILQGQFDSEYLKSQEQIAKNVASQIDFFDYMVGYHEYCFALVNTFVEQMPKNMANQRSQYLRLLLRSIFTDAAVVMYYFFRDANDKAAGEREALAENFTATVKTSFDDMRSAIADIEANSKELGNETEKVRKALSSSNAAPDQVKANVESVAAAAEELSATIGSISDRMNQNKTHVDAISANVDNVVSTNDTLLEVTKQISQITGLINGIASQTNLLALNATIEAARAGEAGRGFAIVAQEVKKLAQDTANATEGISGNVESLQRTVEQISQALGEVRNSVNEVAEGATHISAAVEQQEAASSEIAQNAEYSSTAVHEMAENAQMTLGIADQSYALANQTAGSAQETSSRLNDINQAMESFLSSLKKAS